MDVKYPSIKVTLGEKDVLALLARVEQAMRTSKLPTDEIRAFAQETSNKDYQELLTICQKWVTII